MESSLHNISVKYILGTTILTYILTFLISLASFPLVPNSSILLLGFLLDFSFYFIMFFAIVQQLNKAEINFSHILGQRKLDFKKLTMFFGVALLCSAVLISSIFFLLRLSLFFPLGRQVLEELIPELNATPPSASSGFMKFIIAVIIGPVAEELLFRGILLTKWAQKFGNIKGILFSSGVFMILHIDTLFIPQLLLGFLWAITYIKTKQLIYPILLHSLNNLIPFILEFFSVNEANDLNFTLDIILPSLNIFSLIFLVSAPVLIVFLIRYSKNISKEKIPFEFNKSLEKMN